LEKHLVDITEDAAADIFQAFEWYLGIGATLSERFLSEIAVAIQSLEQNPFSFAIRFSDLRRVNLKKFPYYLLFFLSESERKVVVIGVYHERALPDIRHGNFDE